MAIRARGRVVGGRLRVDIPVDLPDNTEVELAEVIEDTLDDEEDRRLAAILQESDARIARGEEGAPAEEVLARLRSRGRHEALPGSDTTRR